MSDGVVTLDGDINSLAARRLAGVPAWWVPGVRDVVHGEPRRRMAENGVWYVFGVDKVENPLTVLAP
ncbi:BON domain-containing protein [Archangium sp.]|uniref:BON domain-containing protein n=1 Tax=Archangium sp. TaxID=1872627 RepID=UPI003899C44A